MLSKEWKRRKPATNSTYPKVAVQWLNQALYSYLSLCLADSEVLRNRHLRVAAKRYRKRVCKINYVIFLFIIITTMLECGKHGLA
jgi:hypothetical protein